MKNCVRNISAPTVYKLKLMGVRMGNVVTKMYGTWHVQSQDEGVRRVGGERAAYHQ